MSEHPLLLNGDMVRAVLDGSKTQTRRPIKPQPIVRPSGGITWKRTDGERIPNGPRSACGGSCVSATSLIGEYCPFGQVGDTLWVRESFLPCTAASVSCKISDATYVCFRDGTQKYRDTGTIAPWDVQKDPVWKKGYHKFSPSIHMPRWASRISLTITDIRAEPVKDITEADASAEGMNQFTRLGSYRNYTTGTPRYITTMRESFSTLWDSIYGKQKPNQPDLRFDANPWVWAITFNKE